MKKIFKITCFLLTVSFVMGCHQQSAKAPREANDKAYEEKVERRPLVTEPEVKSKEQANMSGSPLQIPAPPENNKKVSEAEIERHMEGRPLSTGPKIKSEKKEYMQGFSRTPASSENNIKISEETTERRFLLTEPAVKSEEQDYKRGLGQRAPAETVIVKGEAAMSMPVVMLEQPALEPTWNFWAQEKIDALKPIKLLEADKKYQVIIHFSAFPYNTDGVFSESSEEYLKDQIKKFTLTDKDLNLVAIIVPDPEFFEVIDGNVKEFKIEGPKIRAFKEHLKNNKKYDITDGKIFEDIENQLKKSPSSLPEYVLGQVDFQIKAVKKTNNKIANIAIALWHNGHPLKDILRLQLCIGATDQQDGVCSDNSKNSKKSNNLPQFSEKSPDGTLQFFKIDEKNNESPVMGIFKNYNQDEYKIWKLLPDYKKLIADMTNIVEELSKNVTTEDDVIEQGSRIFNDFFVGGSNDISGEFIAFVRDQEKKENDPNTNPVIHISFANKYLFLPMQITAIKLAKDEKGQSKYTFLGSNFTVEIPLPETYSYNKTECIKNWMIVIPKASSDTKIGIALNNAGQKGDKNLGDYWLNFSKPEGFDSLSKFKTWLTDDHKITKPTALLILSHHDKFRLFAKGEATIYDDDFNGIENSGDNPMIAILDMCDGSSPEYSGIIEKLNKKKNGAIITTSFAVKPLVAGHFLNCLNKKLDDKGKEISKIFNETMQCMKTDHKHEFHDFYMYQLLGNGQLRLCMPE